MTDNAKGSPTLDAMGPQTILLVDDAPENVLLLSRILDGHGNIVFALNGAEAVEMARDLNPDIILLDIEMPGMDGFSVLKEIRMIEALRTTPVIFVTARADSLNEETGLNLGAIDYISKPFSAPIVRARVRNQLLLRSYAKRLEVLNEKLERLANTDALTGAFNRRHFMQALEIEHERVTRYGAKCLILMLDIDHFKAINDTYGHDIGDKALVAFHEAVAAILRGPDILGRLGGEEFAIIAPETDYNNGPYLVERIMKAVRALSVESGEEEVRFTVSIGCANLADAGKLPANALAMADRALYRAKKEGRDRAIFYDKAVDETDH